MWITTYEEAIVVWLQARNLGEITRYLRKRACNQAPTTKPQ